MARVVVVGGGIFGVTAALSLRTRLASVRGAKHAKSEIVLADSGRVSEPHPLAESTDISKIVRLDYGSDETYTEMMERALDGWRRWNAAWGEPLFHETGVAFLTRAPMAPGGFEHDSFTVLEQRGHRPERLGSADLRRRFPAWNAERFVDGYTHPQGGWAESGAVVARLVRSAVDAGVTLAPAFRAARLVEDGDRVTGIASADGTVIEADEVVVAAGAWTPDLVPSLGRHLHAIGQPVFHLTPGAESAGLFSAETFPVFGGDIARTGFYGFPIQRGVVKIANHGVGRAMHPDGTDAGGPREVTEADRANLRRFLEGAVPALADAPITFTRVCVYSDTFDQHLWIARDPDRKGLLVAAGGSGHGFKFAPLIGDWVADALEGNVVPRFRWRTDVDPNAGGQEQARAGASTLT